jgi:hypothetical protein
VVVVVSVVVVTVEVLAVLDVVLLVTTGAGQKGKVCVASQLDVANGGPPESRSGAMS